MFSVQIPVNIGDQRAGEDGGESVDAGEGVDTGDSEGESLELLVAVGLDY